MFKAILCSTGREVLVTGLKYTTPSHLLTHVVVAGQELPYDAVLWLKDYRQQVEKLAVGHDSLPDFCWLQRAWESDDSYFCESCAYKIAAWLKGAAVPTILASENNHRLWDELADWMNDQSVVVHYGGALTTESPEHCRLCGTGLDYYLVDAEWELRHFEENGSPELAGGWIAVLKIIECLDGSYEDSASEYPYRRADNASQYLRAVKLLYAWLGLSVEAES